MRLWTVQPVAVWDQVRTLGRAFVDPVRADPDGWVHPQYEWLVRQLKARTAFRAPLPWWAYCERPDLRAIRHLRPHGSREVLIEFEAPAAVAFPSWAWNVVFVSDYLPLNRTHYRDWRARLKQAGVGPDDDLPVTFQAEVEASWERLFDPGLSARVPYRDGFTFGASREAVVEVIEAAWVKGVREFVGTNQFMVRASGAA
jgi:hypothetical protein